MCKCARKPWSFAALLMAGSCLAGLPAAAQTVDESPDRDQGGAEAPMRAPEEGEGPYKGLRLGSFLVDPGISVTETYDDNIFAQKTGEEDDLITIVSPTLDVRSDWERHAVGFRAGADIAFYGENQDEDYQDAFVGLNGRYDLSSTSNIFAGLDFAREHEERDSPDDPFAADEPTTYTDLQGVLGTEHRLGDVRLRVGGTAQNLDFRDVDQVGGGEINNDDRDRNQYEVGSRATLLSNPVWQPFVQAAWDVREYDDGRDDFGFERDSDGYSAAIGTNVRLGQGARGEVLAGYMQQDYEDSRFGTVDGLDIGARLNVRATPRVSFNAYLDRSIEETTLIGSPASIDTVGGVTVSHRLSDRLTASVPLYHVRSDFERIDRTDDTTGVGLQLRYLLTSNLYVEGGYNFERRESSDPSEDYDNNIIFARLGAQLSETTFDPVPVYAKHGLYGGLQAGHSVLGTEVDGPRGPGGSGSVGNEQADDGYVAGGFVGYAAMLDRWQYGVELEADRGDADWDHDNAPGDRDFSAQRDVSYGGAVRLGYLLNPRGLVYTRVGLVRTQFDTFYDDGRGNVVDFEETQTGIRFGAGVEVSLSERVFWRADWTYTAYDDYDVDYTRGVDTFDNDESLFRIGLGYRLYDTRADGGEEEARIAHDFNGAYGGGQLGWTWLETENEGGRGRPIGTSFLSVERGGDGPAGGIFGGYGQTFGPIYAGVEVDAEVASADWDVERVPGRRVYSVKKDYAVGGGVRVGYVLADAALIYGRVGAVLGGFSTSYKLADSGVDEDDERTEPGIRFGGGVEVPASERLFVRLDYTFTDYDSYSIDYGPGSDRFDNDESLIRVGVGYRF
ncbi:outer membrane beta-barrel protein [Ferruginivarius sediminum]|nr:outer membrane beta-barrel protein [Ferruginivarius sediminum]